ncbi:MAG: cysteine hydrolase family protein [Actinomycetota bacterium]|nr:cysteine hydrolase family protein [Actinomycetota bacterium]
MPDWKNSTALIVVDVQKGFDDTAFWGERNNGDCEANIAKLIDEWRHHGWPVVFVRHASKNPSSPLVEGSSGFEFKDVITGEPDLLITKSVHSAFYGDVDLDAWLKSHEISGVAVCGIQTNMCCETTARMASDLGYSLIFILDATHTFDVLTPTRKVYRAREIARYTAVTLEADFGDVMNTSDLLAGD